MQFNMASNEELPKATPPTLCHTNLAYGTYLRFVFMGLD